MWGVKGTMSETVEGGKWQCRVCILARGDRLLYFSRMEIRLPDELVRGIDMTKEQWLLDLAIGLFIDRRVTLGRSGDCWYFQAGIFGCARRTANPD